MHVHETKGVSQTAAAAVVIVVVAVIAGSAYLFLGPTGPTNTSTSQTNSSSTAQTSRATFTLTTPVTLSAGGSSFVNPIMQVWTAAFHNQSSLISISYQSIGSGAGQQGIFKGTFDFAGSDAPVTDQQLVNFTGKTLLQVPETLGGVAIFYSVPELGATSIKLTGDVLARIYLQQVTTWNDPAIVALNPGVSLPAKSIIVVHRSDGSGTTFALTDYLSKISPSWKTSVGSGTSVGWPAGELGGKGSSGVAGLVSQNPYSMGYADTVYATQNGLTIASIQNQAGNFVLPTLDSISQAASQFTSQVQSDTRVSITNAPGANSYPIATFTYILVWKGQADQSKGYAIAQFVWWIIHQGQSYGPKLLYPQLPASVVTVDEALVRQMNYNGQAFLG
jgi:phosphate transport system substrate-binding protein